MNTQQLRDIAGLPEYLHQIANYNAIEGTLSLPTSIFVQFICTVYLYDLFVQFTCTIHLYSSLLRFICTIHMFKLLVLFICTNHIYNSNVQFTCTIHMYNSHVKFTCTIQMYNSHVQFTCTTNLYYSYVQITCTIHMFNSKRQNTIVREINLSIEVSRNNCTKHSVNQSVLRHVQLQTKILLSSLMGHHRFTEKITKKSKNGLLPLLKGLKSAKERF